MKNKKSDWVVEEVSRHREHVDEGPEHSWIERMRCKATHVEVEEICKA